MVTIARRFRGPPESGNGGYACGVTAVALGGCPAEVTLRRPPPLERPLHLARVDGTTTLLDGDVVVAEASAMEVDVAAPAPVPFAAAEDAASRFDVDAYESTHAFPGCFVCGPHREAGDGLRLFPATLDGDDLVVSPWVPDASVAEDGSVRAEIVWAALDCPSGMAWLRASDETGPAVLGRMRAAIHRRPALGEQLVVAGWRIGLEGRKAMSGSVVWTDAGEAVAENLATWVVLDEAQQRAFNVR